jgi:hypothetical protein
MAISTSETILPRSISGPALKAVDGNRTIERKTRPVFVVGCHRSGTNLLYDTLLSAGGFAVYRGYLPVYKMLVPRFGSLAKRENRKKTLAAWIRSKGFRRSGMDAEQLRGKVLDECRTAGEFIRIVMGGIAQKQSVARWALYDPDNLLYIPRIREELPEALFVHIIRDGRDVALSLSTMRGFRPFPWNQKPQGLVPTALYWEWMVRQGRQHGLRVPADYLEVRYEELVCDPRGTCIKLGGFLDHDLNYDRIQQASLGSLRQSNSSFLEDSERKTSIERWRSKLSDWDVNSLEAVIGGYLRELGYPLSSAAQALKPGLREKLMRAFYFNLLNTKFWLKTQTPAGRLTNLSALEISELPEPPEAE